MPNANNEGLEVLRVTSKSLRFGSVSLALGAAAVSLAALVVGAAACSSSTPSATCTAYAAPAGLDLTTPVVSFNTDVVPILVTSCGISSSCHSTNRPPVVGSRSSPIATATIYGHLVGIPSTALTTMSFVAPSDTAKSFLMHKVDGDQCLFDTQCEGETCGVRMPQNLDPISVANRDTIRRWIAQGAANN